MAEKRGRKSKKILETSKSTEEVTIFDCPECQDRFFETSYLNEHVENTHRQRPEQPVHSISVFQTPEFYSPMRNQQNTNFAVSSPNNHLIVTLDEQESSQILSNVGFQAKGQQLMLLPPSNQIKSRNRRNKSITFKTIETPSPTNDSQQVNTPSTSDKIQFLESVVVSQEVQLNPDLQLLPEVQLQRVVTPANISGSVMTEKYALSSIVEEYKHNIDSELSSTESPISHEFIPPIIPGTVKKGRGRPRKSLIASVATTATRAITSSPPTNLEISSHLLKECTVVLQRIDINKDTVYQLKKNIEQSSIQNIAKQISLKTPKKQGPLLTEAQLQLSGVKKSTVRLVPLAKLITNNTCSTTNEPNIYSCTPAKPSQSISGPSPSSTSSGVDETISQIIRNVINRAGPMKQSQLNLAGPVKEPGTSGVEEAISQILQNVINRAGPMKQPQVNLAGPVKEPGTFVRCGACSQGFANYNELIGHIETQHPSDESESSSQETVSAQKGGSNNNPESPNSVKQKKFLCCDCDNTFYTRALLESHTQAAHQPKMASAANHLQCNICKGEFTCQANFSKHMQVVHHREL